MHDFNDKTHESREDLERQGYESKPNHKGRLGIGRA